MRFRLREATERDLFEPGQLLFEVIQGDTTHVFKATPADIANLSGLTFHINAGVALPIETPETS